MNENQLLVHVPVVSAGTSLGAWRKDFASLVATLGSRRVSIVSEDCVSLFEHPKNITT